MSKRVVLTGGGTAGHIYPALALAERLKADGCEVWFAGTPNGIESRIVPDAGIPFAGFESSGFNRRHPTTLPKGVARIMKSTRKAKEWFREIKPDAVVAFGGYVSIPVARAAEQTGVPVVVHEQNSVMGMANKYISKKAKAVCLTYEEASKYVPEGVRCVVTGNPVRGAVTRTTRQEGQAYLGIPEDATLLVVFGGSKGARHINEAVAAMKDDLLAIDGLHVVHITGEAEFDATRELLALSADEEKRYHVMGYQDHMAETLAAADAVVSRAGATSLAEISARAIPAILVPYPYATNDHQRTNARAYAEAGAALLVDDSDLGSEAFRQAVLGIASDADERARMHEAMLSLQPEDAAAKLDEVVESCLA